MLSISISPDEDTLWYASLATGYKPGGINGGLNTNPRLYKPFKEEEVESIEIGYKATILDGRANLNLAVFDYSYQGLQAAARPSGPTDAMEDGSAQGPPRLPCGGRHQGLHA